MAHSSPLSSIHRAARIRFSFTAFTLRLPASLLSCGERVYNVLFVLILCVVVFDLLWFGIVVEMEEGRRHGERDNMGGEKGNKEREEGGGRGEGEGEKRVCMCPSSQ